MLLETEQVGSIRQAMQARLYGGCACVQVDHALQPVFAQICSGRQIVEVHDIALQLLVKVL